MNCLVTPALEMRLRGMELIEARTRTQNKTIVVNIEASARIASAAVPLALSFAATTAEEGKIVIAAALWKVLETLPFESSESSRGASHWWEQVSWSVALPKAQWAQASCFFPWWDLLAEKPKPMWT